MAATFDSDYSKRLLRLEEPGQTDDGLRAAGAAGHPEGVAEARNHSDGEAYD